MKVAIITTDSREHYKDYQRPEPYFAAAPEALLQGFATVKNLEVHVISCLQQAVNSPNRIAPNIYYHALHVPKIGWLRTVYQGCIRAVRKLLRSISPNIVHGQGTERDCALCAIFSGYANVLTIHGNMAELARRFDSGWFGRIAARLEDFSIKRTAGVFCNSQYTEELVRSRARWTWRVPNPVRQEFFTPTSDAKRRAKPLLLNIGVVSPRKRQLELLRLAHDLRATGSECELRFIGVASHGDPYVEQFLSELREGEKQGYASYTGLKNLRELILLMDDADAIVHFPSEEAFGLVVAEALARNLKFFGSHVGGIPEISESAPGAELYQPEDWKGLQQGIAQWIRVGFPRPVNAQQLMHARYHPVAIAHQHCNIYSDVLSSPT